MKKGMMMLLLVLSIGFVVAEKVCDMDVSLINQDPYPAIPGDYVKLVFQIDGVDSPLCDDIIFNLSSDYPIEFNPGESGLRVFERVNYLKDYESSILIPYEVRINKDALSGENQIEIQAQSKGGIPFSKTFNIEVSDVRTDFEIYIKDYNYATNKMTLEVLNIGESDIEALSIEIPKQDSIGIKGANRIVVGDLDSNEYTTADFEATPSNGEFKVNLIYSDRINTRRTIKKTVNFDSSYFTNRKSDKTTISLWIYVLWVVILTLVTWWIIKKFKKKK